MRAVVKSAAVAMLERHASSPKQRARRRQEVRGGKAIRASFGMVVGHEALRVRGLAPPGTRIPLRLDEIKRHLGRMRRQREAPSVPSSHHVIILWLSGVPALWPLSTPDDPPVPHASAGA